LSGISPIPFMGMYSASKFAVEGYTEALRQELKPFNIHVSQIEPGFLKTPMMNHRQVAAQTIGAYDPWRQRAYDAIRGHEERGPGPELVADTVLKIVETPAPRLRHVIGGQAKLITNLRRFLPGSAFEQGTRGTFQLDKKS
jgi:NAD(P)-dependent dehydrogenase (short-subunit alcohol dehydrogenase family)